MLPNPIIPGPPPNPPVVPVWVPGSIPTSSHPSLPRTFNPSVSLLFDSLSASFVTSERVSDLYSHLRELWRELLAARPVPRPVPEGQARPPQGRPPRSAPAPPTRSSVWSGSWLSALLPSGRQPGWKSLPSGLPRRHRRCRFDRGTHQRRRHARRGRSLRQQGRHRSARQHRTTPGKSFPQKRPRPASRPATVPSGTPSCRAASRARLPLQIAGSGCLASGSGMSVTCLSRPTPERRRPRPSCRVKGDAVQPVGQRLVRQSRRLCGPGRERWPERHLRRPRGCGRPVDTRP